MLFSFVAKCLILTVLVLRFKNSQQMFQKKLKGKCRRENKKVGNLLEILSINNKNETSIMVNKYKYWENVVYCGILQKTRQVYKEI